MFDFSNESQEALYARWLAEHRLACSRYAPARAAICACSFMRELIGELPSVELVTAPSAEIGRMLGATQSPTIVGPLLDFSRSA